MRKKFWNGFIQGLLLQGLGTPSGHDRTVIGGGFVGDEVELSA